MAWFRKNHIIWFLLLAGTIIMTRGLVLDRFVTTDETPWLMRSGNFYYALGQREFINTKQQLDPAVTTMWINTAAFLIEAPQYRGFGQGYFIDYGSFDRFLQTKNIDPHKILITGRKLMLLENLILLLVAFGIAIRLIGVAPAFAAFMLIALDPFHIALTTVSHTDGQLSCLMFLSILAFLGYSFDKPAPIYLVLSAGVASLACLTKLPGYLLFPFFLTFMLIKVIRKWKNGTFKDKKQLRIWGKRIFRDIVIWGAVFSFLYIIIWPVMWVDPLGMIDRQITAPFKFLMSDVLSPMVATSNAIEESLTIGSGVLARVTFYPVRYLWRATPIELLGIFLAVFAFVFKVGMFKSPKNRKLVILLTWFVFLYFVFMSFTTKVSTRYMIPAIVVLDVLAAFGWVALLQLILVIKNRWIKYSSLSAILLCIVIVQVGGDALVYPYFFSYYNPLMGGGKKAGETIFVGSGEGLDEAGRYLSQKPDSSNLTAMSWYGSGCFSYYFSGKTIYYSLDDLDKVDYLIVYTNQWYRQITPHLFEILAEVKPEHTIWINGIEYARIYKVEELPPKIYEY